MGLKMKKRSMPYASSVLDGRSDWIRTSGHLNPIQVLYQTEPHPETRTILYTKKVSMSRGRCKKIYLIGNYYYCVVIFYITNKVHLNPLKSEG